MIAWLNKNAAAPWLQNVRRHGAWIVVVVTILFVAGVRLRLCDMPLERDEGEYAYTAQLMLQGIAPYAHVYTQKLPGTAAVYAASMVVFGQTASGIHIGLTLVNAGSILLMFYLGRRLLDDVAGAVTAISFALMTLNPWVLGLAGHATHYVVLFALLGLLALLRACDARMENRHGRSRSSGAGKLLGVFRLRMPLFFISGLCFGLAFLMKQHGVFFGVFGGVYLIWRRAGDWMTGRLIEVPLRSGRSESSEGGESEGRSRALIPSRSGRLRHDLRGPGRFNAEVKGVIGEVLIFAAGCIVPYLITCIMLGAAGAFHEFVFWTISYARKYSSAIPFVKGSDVVRASVAAVIGPNLVLWILPLIGAVIMWWETRLDEGSRRLEASSRRKNDVGSPWSWASTPAPGFHAQRPDDEEEATEDMMASPPGRRIPYSTIRYPRVFLTGLLLCSAASVSVGLYFRAHYFILLLPALALLTGVAVSRGVFLLRNDRTIELFLALPIVLLFVIAIGAALVGNGSTWLAMTPKQAMTSVYGTTLFSEVIEVADYIKANSAANARVAVLGSEPEIYFYARRQSATGYIYTYPLMEQHEFALKMQEQMIAEIERAQPEFLVYVDDDYSWLVRPDSERKIFEWWKDYWATNLDLVKTIEFQEGFERGNDIDSASGRGQIKGSVRGNVSSGHVLILKRR